MKQEDKIEKVYWSISEAAEIVRQATSTLRFWEKEFKWLKPQKNRNGNRRYNKKDIQKLLTINWQLKGVGMTVEGVKKAREMCYDKELVEFVAMSQRSYQPPGKKEYEPYFTRNLLSLIFISNIDQNTEMNKFNELAEEMEIAKLEGDKFYVNDNMQAGKRFFASLMNIERKCKAAREELSVARKGIREDRQHGE